MVRVLHTGDVHIGMKYTHYPDDIRIKLSQARFATLDKTVSKANDLDADIFVVAGDLFNTIGISKKDINEAASILNRFNGSCVLVLPGNHDYDNGAIDLWKEFSNMDNEKILLIKEKKPYILEDYKLDVVIYPAPCHNKHSKDNSLGWIKEAGLLDRGKYHIGVGHGALEGLSPDIEGNYYYMSMEELNAIPMDLWLLGHTHVSYPSGEHLYSQRIFNAGTPEPDGLDYREEGSAWLIDIKGDKVEAKKVFTGEYRFFDKEFILNSDDQLDDIRTWTLRGNPKKSIIRLTLNGNISKEAYQGLSEFYRELESKVFYLIIEDSKLRIKVSEEIIKQEFVEGSFPYEFLKELSQDEDALQIAYDLLRRE